MKISVPSPKRVKIGVHWYRLVAFYYPGYNEPWDDVYNAPFLGNFWVTEVTITVPDPYGKTGKTATFHTAEAAFQATKWWDMYDKQHHLIRPQFEACKTGDAAFQLRKRLDGKPPYESKEKVEFDHKYAGLQQDGAMQTVLEAKFQDKDLQAGLLATGAAYLLEHNETEGRDLYWSDNCDGTGQNQLGRALMKIRKAYGGEGAPSAAKGEDPLDVADFTRKVKPERKCLKP